MILIVNLKDYLNLLLKVMKIDISKKKKELRKILSQNREIIKKNNKDIFNIKLFNNLIEKLNFEKINKVASFISTKSEISTNKLNNHIKKLDKTLCFPTSHTTVGLFSLIRHHHNKA